MRALLALFTLATLSTAPLAAQSTPDSTKKDQPASLEGSWSGSASMQGQDLPMSATFKKAGDKWAGSITAMQGESAFTDITIEGEKVTAVATMATPNGNIEVWYTLILKGDTLTGQAEASFNGQGIQVPIYLKKAP
jgi:hypothetical protein